MNTPANLRYSEEHEWVAVESGVATIGITDFAQEELGDIVFVELPNVGDTLQRSKTLGVVESVKAVSDVYAPVGGTVHARSRTRAACGMVFLRSITSAGTP